MIYLKNKVKLNVALNQRNIDEIYALNTKVKISKTEQMKRDSFLYFIIFLVLFFAQAKVFAQTIHFEMSEIYANPLGSNSDLVSFIPLFQLESDSILHNKEKSLPYVKLPFSIDTSELAYGYIFFKGVSNSKFENEVAIIVENYLDTNPKILVDKNGNLDFTDDGAAFTSRNNFILKLKNQRNTKAAYHLNLSKSQISKKNQTSLIHRYQAKNPNAKIISPSNWLCVQRLSLKILKDHLDGSPITVMLNDLSVDGLFSFDSLENEDRILIVEGHADLNSDLTSLLRSSEPINKNAVFELYGKNYRLDSVSETGDLVSLIKTDGKPQFFYDQGMDISTLTFDLLNGDPSTIKSLLKDSSYLILSIGGTWCGGCTAQLPSIKKIYKSNRVNVLGLFEHDTHQSVTQYVQKHKIDWSVALLPKSYKELFRLRFFPTYILVSPRGTFLLASRDLEEISRHLMNE